MAALAVGRFYKGNANTHFLTNIQYFNSLPLTLTFWYMSRIQYTILRSAWNQDIFVYINNRVQKSDFPNNSWMDASSLIGFKSTNKGSPCLGNYQIGSMTKTNSPIHIRSMNHIKKKLSTSSWKTGNLSSNDKYLIPLITCLKFSQQLIPFYLAWGGCFLINF